MKEPNVVPANIDTLSKKTPNYTCPRIDALVEIAEELRASNEALRENAEHWEARAREYFKLAEAWEYYAHDLANQLEDYRKQAA